MTCNPGDSVLPGNQKTDTFEANFKTSSHVQTFYGRRACIHGNTDGCPRIGFLRGMESPAMGQGNRHVRPRLRTVLHIPRHYTGARSNAAD